MRYAVRKIERKWALCVGRLRILEFDRFEDALHVATNAASILVKAHKYPLLARGGMSAQASLAALSGGQTPHQLDAAH
jgi:hypothetical protein